MLGEILVRKGRIRRENLASALTDARAAGERLGTYLVRTRVLYEQDISVALADQFGLRYVVVDPRELDPSLAPVLPERVARKYGVLPIARIDERIRFAVADPTDVLLTDELRIVVEGPFELVVADPSSIRAGLDAVYTAPRTPFGDISDSDDEDIVVTQNSTQARVHDLDDLESAPAVEEVNRLLRKAI
jgi:type IV pilus assembly protein PilB